MQREDAPATEQRYRLYDITKHNCILEHKIPSKLEQFGNHIWKTTFDISYVLRKLFDSTRDT